MDYKEMYLELFRATEKAINILIDAQQKCEEKYISENDVKDNIIDFLYKKDK